MPKFFITALVRPIEEELNPYLDSITDSAARRRVRESLAKTDAFLAEFPTLTEVSRNPLSGLVTIFADEDIRELLVARNFTFIMLEEGHRIFANGYKLFSIEGINASRENIQEVMENEFGELEKDGNDAFFVPIHEETLGEKPPIPAWILVMRRIEEILEENDIQAIIGVWKMPSSLSPHTALKERV